MHIILLLLGIVSVAAGVGMVIFGIPDVAFGLGNTLIMSGVFSIVGGLVLIGLGSVVSHLRRIRDAIEAQGSRAALRLGQSGKADEEPLRPPVLAPQPSFGSEHAARPETTEVAVPDPHIGPPGHVGLKDPLTGAGLAAASQPAMPSPGIAPDIRSVPERSDAPTRKTEWPQVDSADRTAHEAARPRDLSGAASPQETLTPATPGTPPPADAEPGAPTILKSGVIEGMAYTLYSDGSIEAELPRGGMMRFASIPELRAHLRDNP